MLVSADQFINMPVMSLQTGSELGRTAQAIIDPRDLGIVAYQLTGPTLDADQTLLRIEDIREIGPLGAIVDSSDELVTPSDIIALKTVYEYQFSLEGKPVFDNKKHRLGRVVGYTLLAGNFLIQQLRVRRPLLRSFGQAELLIHRSQIDSVSDEAIIVKSTALTQSSPSSTPTRLPANFRNPFRDKPAA